MIELSKFLIPDEDGNLQAAQVMGYLEAVIEEEKGKLRGPPTALLVRAVEVRNLLAEAALARPGLSFKHDQPWGRKIPEEASEFERRLLSLARVDSPTQMTFTLEHPGSERRKPLREWPPKEESDWGDGAIGRVYRQLCKGASVPAHMLGTPKELKITSDEGLAEYYRDQRLQRKAYEFTKQKKAR